MSSPLHTIVLDFQCHIPQRGNFRQQVFFGADDYRPYLGCRSVPSWSPRQRTGRSRVPWSISTVQDCRGRVPIQSREGTAGKYPIVTGMA